METLDMMKVILPSVVAFWIGIFGTPLLTHYLFKYRVWKKKGGKQALDGTAAVEFGKLRTDENETRTPRMGGIVIWASVFVTAIMIWLLATWFPGSIFSKLDFISRNQTWIPLLTLVFGGLIGAINDVLDVAYEGGEKGITLKTRLLIITILSTAIGWWFYDKLDVVSVGLPFLPDITVGWGIVPLFVATTLFLYASGVIDGIDGLSGGVFASVFAAYALIAFNQDQINLAAFCATVVGALMAFLWFNIPPARFWMTETGTMGITITISVVAFMTDSLGGGEGITVLPIIGALLVLTVASNILQVVSKKLRGKKLFRIAPLHHHFEAIGWPSYKVTMRYWVLSIMFAFLGVIIALAG